MLNWYSWDKASFDCFHFVAYALSGYAQGRPSFLQDHTCSNSHEFPTATLSRGVDCNKSGACHAELPADEKNALLLKQKSLPMKQKACR